MTPTDKLEVFQDLVLRGPGAGRARLRDALIARVAAPWRHANDGEQDLAEMAGGADVMAFERAAGNSINAVRLVLWSRGDDFEVTNIVPLDVSELGVRRYNAALEDFASRVACPAAPDAGYSVFLSPARQDLEDWLPNSAAAALRRFSATANKGTGSSHPSDRKRWFAFLIAAHTCAVDLDTDRLVRWLVEVEGWSDETAHDLAIQYEFARGLLEEYDSSRM